MRKRTRRVRAGWLVGPAVALAVAGGALGVTAASGSVGSKKPPNPNQLGDLPVNPQWLSNTLERATTTTSVKNNTLPEAIRRRNKAEAAWNAAEARWKAGNGREPSPLAKPEYLVVWSGKQNAADVYGKE